MGTVFADRYRIEDVITHGARKWTYLASDMKARGIGRLPLPSWTQALLPPLASEKWR